ncbi:MAG TPA: hypothetical protein VGR97_10480, partial [Candidatus Acidoferrales bacterium]|nr:hypothetical protein [Candidatus Acidoferrales bacterium]
MTIRRSSTPENIRGLGIGIIVWPATLLVCFVLAGCGGSAIHSPNQPVSLTISAAISLKEPLDSFTQNY